MPSTTGINSEGQANYLLEALIGADNATLPDIDLFDDSHTVPWDADSDVFKPVEKLDVSELVADFQAIMAALAAQLKVEYDAGHITGATYAQTYLAVTQAALGNAVQFTLGKDQAFWMAAKAQADAITAMNQNEAVRLQAMLSRAEFALTKLKLSTEDSAFGTSEDTRKNMLPAQITLVKEQMESQRAQTQDTRSDGTTVIYSDTESHGLSGKQMALYAQQKQSYIDDTKIKAAKVFSDLWVTRKTLDEATGTPSIFNTDITDAGTGLDTYNGIFGNLKTTAGG